MSPRREDDDGGPSDEEGSSASEQIQQTPSNEQPADASTVEEDVHNPATDDGEEDNADNSNGLGTPSAQRITPVTSAYESFGGKSISSAISSPKAFKHEDDTPDDESISMPKSRIANKTKRGQVLVHYHPQLGDEGFESTLVPDTIEEAPPTTPSSRGRPMDESGYYSGGAAGMNSRMMEDVRDGRTYNSSSEPPSSPMNDEQNNAATRQIRRRVFRAALERGIHDERRMKMLDADADIGGPSLRGGGAVNKSNDIGSSTSYHRNPGGGMNSRSRDTDDQDIPQKMSYTKTNISTRTPKSYENNSFSPTAATQQQTISPPAPPAGPPSYRTIIQKLIKDNEPQKLPQLDKVLAKYNGREEELILKLDARYKKMKQKSDAILQDLETSEKQKEPVSLAARSGEGKQSLEDHGGIKQMNSWDSKKSKDVYFVKVPKSPLHQKLPSDIIDSNKTAPHSNVRKALAMEDEEDGDIPAIPKCNAAPAEVAAAAAANEAKVSELRTVEKEETITSPTLREPYKFNMAPSYGDEISVITMETKETLKKKKNDRGEDTYSWLQRPPNSITVEGGSGSKVEESPLSPERKSKINKLLPDFDQEKEEDKAKASDAKLVPVALNDVEARIRARRKIMEEEAKNKAVSDVDAKKDSKTKIEKDNDGFSDADNTASIIEDAESFVGKRKSTVPASTQEDEVQPSLIDHQERLLQAAPTQSKAVKEEPKRMETTQAALEMGGDDDLDEEEGIDLLLKESRLQAEKAIALRKAQRELEKEKKARMEAEAARIALEEELARLKAEAAGDKKPIVPQEENVIESDSDEDDAVDVAAEDQGDTPEEPFKYDLNKTFSSVSDADDKSEQENVNETVLLDATLPLEDTDGVLPDGVDIDEASAGSVKSSENEVDVVEESSDEDEDLSAYKYQVLNSARGSVIAADEITPTQADGMMKKDVDKVEESIPRDSGDIISPPTDEVATKKIDEKVDQSLGQGVTQRNEHDFPSTTMVHASPSQDVSSEQKSDADEDANINHVATMMFEGNRAKGQLSFTTGSKILAHSNQRGPWWLGRCGKQTGWFPANAVVPESEYLKNIAIALPAEMDETGDRLRELSNEELAATYDLIRNPSDPIDDVVDDDDNDDDDDPGSPARSRWLDDTSNKNATQSSRSDSPPPTRSDPSMMEGLNQRLYEPDESNAVDSAPQLGFEGMNRLGKSIEERSEDKPKKTYIGPPQAVTETVTETDSPKIVQTNSGSKSKKKKKPQEWKAAQDPGTGLTYYYHLKTRETTWEKPVDFDEAAAAEKDDAKGKGLSGGKILRIFSKKKKPKTPTEDESVTPSSTFSFSFDDGKKPATKAASNLTTENVVATRTVAGNASGKIIFPEHDDDDDSSSSDGSSLFSRENIYNKKKKLQNSVRKFTDKFSQEVISPKKSYEQLSGDEEGKNQIEVADAGIELNYPVTSEPKKANPVQWRSAIDAATGRTYYYQKGGTETFWTKPKDMP